MDESLTDEQRIARWRQRDAQPCPVCQAEPKEPCTLNGQSMGTAMHYQRGRTA